MDSCMYAQVTLWSTVAVGWSSWRLGPLAFCVDVLLYFQYNVLAPTGSFTGTIHSRRLFMGRVLEMSVSNLKTRYNFTVPDVKQLIHSLYRATILLGPPVSVFDKK